jgi:COP9 signalosome complex subunit 4
VSSCHVCFGLLQTGADGIPLPERAALEHNMLAVSRLYENVRFSELALMLSIDEYRAEKVSQPSV